MILTMRDDAVHFVVFPESRRSGPHADGASAKALKKDEKSASNKNVKKAQ
jgi:hypothetical protein